ncbi:hypothetical protein BH24PSE2_BH24PSE2_09470 [soil metagenome]
MKKRANGRVENLRRRLALEAARIIEEHGVEDFRLAKRKAAERFGVGDQAALPKNSEIEAALGERQRLFAGEAHARWLHRLRTVAHKTMSLLAEFEPRLVGPVLSGTATRHSQVLLHVFAEAPESIALRLMEHEIPYRTCERRLRMNTDRVVRLPGYRFIAGEITVETTVFPPHGVRQAPMSPVDGRPMRRAPLSELERLLP